MEWGNGLFMVAVIGEIASMPENDKGSTAVPACGA
jgi:hypothetical protein